MQTKYGVYPILQNLNMHMVVLITINVHTKFEISSFICCKDMIETQKFRN